jgi:hypothetical protein
VRTHGILQQGGLAGSGKVQDATYLIASLQGRPQCHDSTDTIVCKTEGIDDLEMSARRATRLSLRLKPLAYTHSPCLYHRFGYGGLPEKSKPSSLHGSSSQYQCQVVRCHMRCCCQQKQHGRRCGGDQQQQQQAAQDCAENTALRILYVPTVQSIHWIFLLAQEPGWCCWRMCLGHADREAHWQVVSGCLGCFHYYHIELFKHEHAVLKVIRTPKVSQRLSPLRWPTQSPGLRFQETIQGPQYPMSAQVSFSLIPTALSKPRSYPYSCYSPQSFGVAGCRLPHCLVCTQDQLCQHYLAS